MSDPADCRPICVKCGQAVEIQSIREDGWIQLAPHKCPAQETAAARCCDINTSHPGKHRDGCPAETAVECSSFCHPKEPCSITDDGKCDANPTANR